MHEPALLLYHETQALLYLRLALSAALTRIVESWAFAIVGSYYSCDWAISLRHQDYCRARPRDLELFIFFFSS